MLRGSNTIMQHVRLCTIIALNQFKADLKAWKPIANKGLITVG